ncbi:MAG: hypothetical protein HYZ14_05640 [Bacteroidetes bacterium]|nr:hypothetical protein [Bacteroidota bacterium]
MPEKEQQVTFIYEDSFSEEEQAKLETWIRFTSDAAQKVLGEFPFDLYYHFHREDSAIQAVLFGHTARTDSINAAHFYVDPSYSLDDLKADWIAPHEISHLAIPKLGKTNLWFFEGFATYMSRQVMIETGVLKPAQTDSINLARIAAVRENFETTSLLPFVADSLIAAHQYPAVYWMGASFFDQADKRLQAAGKGPLVDVLKKFQECCHVTTMSIEEVIESFDKISGTFLFSELYTYYTTTPCNEILVTYKASTPIQ